MFPGPGARVFYNEDGEPTGWDYPDYDAPEDEGDYYDDYDEADYEEEADPATCRHDGWDGTGKAAVCSWCDTHAVGEEQDGTYEDGTPFMQPIWPAREGVNHVFAEDAHLDGTYEL